jgi:hypothetical protein
MKQYLVAIRDGDVFYRLVDDAEALDNLFTCYGACRIIGCWEMQPPSFDERLGTGDAEGDYPGCKIIPLEKQ